ncbi:MAG: metallophosphoesterase [Armatimonadota bacterium]
MRWDLLSRIGLGVLAGAIIWKGYENSTRLELSQETVAIPDLPPAFDGFRLLHLTDLHLWRHSPRAGELLAIVEQLQPDLVCLTGDYSYTALSLDDADTFLQRLAEKTKAVGVFGNADYRDGHSKEVHERWGHYLPFLTNTALCLEKGGNALWIAGVDDPHLGRDSLPTALSQVPPEVPVILLAHSPEIIRQPLDPRIRLILSGHTHGGQWCLPGGKAIYLNAKVPRAYASGRHDLDGVTLYVSRGIGSTRIPLRYACLPEITQFTLAREG